MRRPPLTERVLVGLEKMAACAPAVDVLNHAATLEDVEGYCTAAELEDVIHASEWIDQTRRWFEWRKQQGKLRG